jgi:hypothetical protein
MSELAIRDETPLELGGLVQWAEEARAAASIAHSLAKTPFVPNSLRSTDRDHGYDITVANITAAILTGRELNLQPMASLRSIDVIQGTPAMRALLMRALVQSAGHDVWTEKESASEVVVCGRRHGSDKTEKSTWTIGRAQQLGLTGKDNWKKQPQAMLVARATAEVCRRVAADVLLGLPYAVEELDGDTAEVAEPPKRRTARRQPPPEPVPVEEPALDEPAGPASEAVFEEWPEVAPIPEPEPS